MIEVFVVDARVRLDPHHLLQRILMLCCCCQVNPFLLCFASLGFWNIWVLGFVAIKIYLYLVALVSTTSIASGIFPCTSLSFRVSLFYSSRILWEKIVVVVERLDYSMWCFWNFLCSESSGVTSWCKLTEKKHNLHLDESKNEPVLSVYCTVCGIVTRQQHFNLWFALSDSLLRQPF